jgi:hypothetical protein
MQTETKKQNIWVFDRAAPIWAATVSPPTLLNQKHGD